MVVGLVLAHEPGAVGQLVAHGGRDGEARPVAADVGLGRVGEVDAGDAHERHGTRRQHRLGVREAHGKETRVAVVQRSYLRRRGPCHGGEVAGGAARGGRPAAEPTVRDGPQRGAALVHAAPELLAEGRQALGALLGREGAHLLQGRTVTGELGEGGPAVVEALERHEERPRCRDRGCGRHRAAPGGGEAATAAGADDGRDGACEVDDGHDGRRDDDPLRHGEGHEPGQKSHGVGEGHVGAAGPGVGGVRGEPGGAREGRGRRGEARAHSGAARVAQTAQATQVAQVHDPSSRRPHHTGWA